MNWKNILVFGLISIIFVSCKKDIAPLDSKTASLVQILNQALNPLTENPLTWSDNDLKFLDPIADKSIIGLGEATHGTAEFFKAKHRIFRYLVENHNYKIFAIEADFGESLLINEAVQSSDTSEIENLMKTKMKFWTWRTEEVKDLLMWMCNYNFNKSEAEKVQYMGVDCQFNTYNPGLLKDYLTRADAPFLSFAEGILDEAETASETSFKSYTLETFNNLLGRIYSLQDSVTAYKNELIQKSSEKQYQLNTRILKIVVQVSVEVYYYQKSDYNYRDKYMADNTAWLRDHFDGEKIVLWAHNGHIADDPDFDSMGYHLTQSFATNYATIGFLFSRGSFTAVGFEGGQYTSPKEQLIDVDPSENSINFVMSRCKESVFSVKVADLQNHSEWSDAFASGIYYFDIGSVFNYNLADYYKVFKPTFFDFQIYFDKSTASVLL
jgi:erythromycin esterase